MWIGYEEALNARRDLTTAGACLRNSLYSDPSDLQAERVRAARALLVRAITLLDEALDEE